MYESHPDYSAPQADYYAPRAGYQSSDDAPSRWQLTEADRIVPRPKRSVGRRIVRAAMLAMFLGATAWTAFGDTSALQEAMPDWLRREASALYTSLGQRLRQAIATATTPQAAADPPAGVVPATTEAASASDGKSAPALPPPREPPREAIEAPPVAALQVVTTAALPPTATAHPEENGPAPKAATARQLDAVQLRAEAAGLSPDLSHALLERLTSADFKNAGVAVAKALAETPDDGVYVWPRQRASGVAVFEVRFVPGAPSDCRRYVVVILKDRWSTTAMPMEKCGIDRRTARRG